MTPDKKLLRWNVFSENQPLRTDRHGDLIPQVHQIWTTEYEKNLADRRSGC
jgi:hypothetical protein